MSSPDITSAEIAAITHVLHTRWLSQGPNIVDFERAFARFIGVRYAVGVNAGVSGVHLALIAAGVTAGDEVITSALNIVTSANCVLYERARPVFVDVDPRTGTLDPALIETAITPRTKAIMPAHLFGQPADLDPMRAVAERHGLRLIEDACDAVGSEYKGRRVGTIGDAAAFAFGPERQMTSGEGGMVVTSHALWNDLFRSLRNQGRDMSDQWLRFDRLGYNYRLDEMSAALGRVQLQRIDELLEKRAQVAAWYTERVAQIDGIQMPYVAETTTRMNWSMYVVRCRASIDRARLTHYLASHGVPSRSHVRPIHLQSYYRQLGYRRGALPHTERISRTLLALPFSSVMTQEQVEFVCGHLRDGIGAAQR